MAWPTKNTEKENKKKAENTYLTPTGEGPLPAQPAHLVHGGLLPRPAHTSAPVECHRPSRATATPPAYLEASQASLSRPGDTPECHACIPPLQRNSFLLPHRFLPP